MLHQSRLLILILTLAIPLLAQPSDDRVVVLTGVGSPPTASLIEIDVSTGTTQPLGGFASAVYPPLALTWDPINGGLIVAVQLPTVSRVVRLTFQGTAVLTERLLATFPSPVTDLAIAIGGDVIVSTDGPTGGLWRVARNGGVPVQIVSLPFVTALDVPYSSQAMVVQSLPTGDPVLSFVPLGGGAPMPYTVPGLAGLRITGVVDFPTGAIRQGLSDDQGGLHRYEFLSQVTPWIMPPLPVGATRELVWGPTGDALTVGGSASPYIRGMPVFGTTATTLAGPLAGDPVDLTVTGPGGPRYARFGAPCAGASTTWTNFPAVGANVVIGLQGAQGATPSVLAIGLSDQSWLGVSLPFITPGGCPLYVSVDTELWTTTDAAGSAQVSISIPNLPAVAGTVVFGQWGQLTTTGWQTSDALAAHIR